MKKTSWLTAALCAATVAGAGAGAALAGEVTGNGKATGAPQHANSICAFSGQNDYNQGPTDFHVQSFGQDVRAGRADPKAFNPGDACRGGSNPDNPPS